MAFLLQMALGHQRNFLTTGALYGLRTPGSSLLQQALPLQDTGLRNYSLRYLRKDQNSLTMKAAWLVRSQFRFYPVWSVVL